MVLPRPDNDSGSLDAVLLLRSLTSLEHNVTFAFLFESPGDHEYIEKLFIEVPRLTIVKGSIHHFKAWLTNEIHGFDFLIASRVEVALQIWPIIQETHYEGKHIFNTVDLGHLRLERQAKIQGDIELLKKAESLKRAEIELIRRFDNTLVISGFEKEYLRQFGLDESVIYLPMVRDFPSVVPGFDERRGFCFVGFFGHPPNLDGLQWFFNAVWLHILRVIPNATLNIYGSSMPEYLRIMNVPRANFNGFAPDLSRVLCEPRVTIAPLRFGAGTKGKVISSICHGTPVVATSVAAEGIMPFSSGVYVADDPVSFALTCCALHHSRHLWTDCHNSALQHRSLFAKDNFERILSGALTP
jgi:glycosyltransferase involved in cell wall biosynthesis